jgi:lysophospholipase L1-like esterase
MKRRPLTLTIVLVAFGALLAGCATNSPTEMVGMRARTSFAEFDRRARAREPLTVVFFGGSLTWGANASDPNRTSERGLMMKYLRERYPRTPFHFVDAAIGGTGSTLAIFRVDRDVLSYDPDLVFLDFTANDGLFDRDVPTLMAYETLVRRMVSRGIPVCQVFYGFKWSYSKAATLAHMHRYQSHLKIAAAYHTGVADTLPGLCELVAEGKESVDVMWPIDGAHPGDHGYEVFFRFVREGFEQAMAEGRICTVPEKPVFGAFSRVERIRLSEHLPEGWTKERTFRTSLWFDGLSSRWMDDVAVCDARNRDQVKPLRMEFDGTLVGLFGEANQDGLSFRVRIDGEPVPYQPDKKKPAKPTWPTSTARFGTGNLFFWRLLARDLAPGKHVLEVESVFEEGTKHGQLRIGSVCVAGP